MSDRQARLGLRALKAGGFSEMGEAEFQAWYEAAVQEHARRNGWDGQHQVSYPRRSSAFLCDCGLGFRTAEDGRLHLYPQLLYGRDPTFYPREKDVVRTKDGEVWTVTGVDRSVRFVYQGGLYDCGLGHFRLMCGIEYGGEIIRYAEDQAK